MFYRLIAIIALIPINILATTSLLRAETNAYTAPELPTSSQELDSLTVIKGLPYESVKIGVDNICADGNILGFIIGEGKNIRIFQEYSKYRIDPDNQKSRIGIQLRLNVEILNIKSNLNLASLIGIGVAASAGKVKGKLTLNVYGISGSAITNALPLPSELSESSIVSSLQAISNIKSRLYDKDIVISEQILPEEKTVTECSCQGGSCPITP